MITSHRFPIINLAGATPPPPAAKPTQLRPTLTTAQVLRPARVKGEVVPT
jgi:hypothetical protein